MSVKGESLPEGKTGKSGGMDEALLHSDGEYDYEHEIPEAEEQKLLEGDHNNSHEMVEGEHSYHQQEDEEGEDQGDVLNINMGEEDLLDSTAEVPRSNDQTLDEDSDGDQRTEKFSTERKKISLSAAEAQLCKPKAAAPPAKPHQRQQLRPGHRELTVPRPIVIKQEPEDNPNPQTTPKPAPKAGPKAQRRPGPARKPPQQQQRNALNKSGQGRRIFSNKNNNNKNRPMRGFQGRPEHPHPDKGQPIWNNPGNSYSQDLQVLANAIQPWMGNQPVDQQAVLQNLLVELSNNILQAPAMTPPQQQQQQQQPIVITSNFAQNITPVAGRFSPNIPLNFPARNQHFVGEQQQPPIIAPNRPLMSGARPPQVFSPLQTGRRSHSPKLVFEPPPESYVQMKEDLAAAAAAAQKPKGTVGDGGEFVPKPQRQQRSPGLHSQPRQNQQQSPPPPPPKRGAVGENKTPLLQTPSLATSSNNNNNTSAFKSKFSFSNWPEPPTKSHTANQSFRRPPPPPNNPSSFRASGKVAGNNQYRNDNSSYWNQMPTENRQTAPKNYSYRSDSNRGGGQSRNFGPPADDVVRLPLDVDFSKPPPSFVSSRPANIAANNSAGSPKRGGPPVTAQAGPSKQPRVEAVQQNRVDSSSSSRGSFSVTSNSHGNRTIIRLKQPNNEAVDCGTGGEETRSRVVVLTAGQEGGAGKSDKPAETVDDDYVRLYNEKIAQQKLERERVLRMKEERRLKMVAQPSQAASPVTAAPPKTHQSDSVTATNDDGGFKMPQPVQRNALARKQQLQYPYRNDNREDIQDLSRKIEQNRALRLQQLQNRQQGQQQQQQQNENSNRGASLHVMSVEDINLNRAVPPPQVIGRGESMVVDSAETDDPDSDNESVADFQVSVTSFASGGAGSGITHPAQQQQKAGFTQARVVCKRGKSQNSAGVKPTTVTASSVASTNQYRVANNTNQYSVANNTNQYGAANTNQYSVANNTNQYVAAIANQYNSVASMPNERQMFYGGARKIFSKRPGK